MDVRTGVEFRSDSGSLCGDKPIQEPDPFEITRRQQGWLSEPLASDGIRDFPLNDADCLLNFTPTIPTE